ncbi:hypothetical protein LP52_05380 [Streptomonospora alba]|uniref:CBS domain-containing protein n=1 Tax=Streptomonospora alba TaxID=183763 RepID=A0A0C2FK05_9ACTN|nr:CBS domain-containing protein [Streptomonospora alba]KIH99679.1 hypothetical protein LP52_05380 [Streptomonospora alba]
MATVREIMTRNPECAQTDHTLQAAAEQMERLGVGGLPICGPENRLKGMITDRDIVVRGLARGRRLDTPVGELNQGEAVTVGADDSTDELLSTMTHHQVKRLPVIDGDRLVGIVTIADAARALPNPESGDLLDALSME